MIVAVHVTMVSASLRMLIAVQQSWSLLFSSIDARQSDYCTLSELYACTVYSCTYTALFVLHARPDRTLALLS